MHSLQNFNYNGQIIQRRSDGFVSLTQMCAANGKRLDVFMKAKKTQEYIDALSHSLQMVVVDANEGGDHSGTWGHPSLAINLARWISADFAVWCDAHIFNLMATGQTSLAINPIEEMKLKIELAKLENQKADTELKLLQFRSTITRTCPEPLQQKILGYQVVEKVEYRDRVIANNQVINNGETLNKTELCHRYNILTKNGKPDYRRLNFILEQKGIVSLSDAWEMSAVIQENYQFKREYLPMLDDLMLEGDRQLFFGE
jgi:hypothetical protein